MKINFTGSYTSNYGLQNRNNGFNNRKISLAGAPEKSDFAAVKPSFPIQNNFIINFGSSKANRSINDIDPANIEGLGKHINPETLPLIFTDFDGVLSDLIRKPLEAKIHDEDRFLNIFGRLNEANVPFFILTGRQISDFEKFVLKDKMPANFNRIGIYGNEFDIRLPKSEKTDRFMKCWQNRPGFQLKAEDESDKYHIMVRPFIELDSLKQEKIDEITSLEELGMSVENKCNASYFMKWEDLKTEVIDSHKNGGSLVKSVSKPLFERLQIWNEQNDFPNNRDEGEFGYLTIQNEDSEMKISMKKLILFAVQTLNNSSKIIFGENLPDINANSFNFRKSDFETQWSKANVRKEEILKSISAIYENVKPLYLGDSISGGKVDEKAIIEAQKLGGIGIAVKTNSTDEIMIKNLGNRENLTTQAQFKLDSFKDTLDCFEDILKLFSSQMN